jgi:hypothetical protein
MPRIGKRIFKFGSATYEEKSDLENALLQHLKSLDIRVLPPVILHLPSRGQSAP